MYKRILLMCVTCTRIIKWSRKFCFDLITHLNDVISNGVSIQCTPCPLTLLLFPSLTYPRSIECQTSIYMNNGPKTINTWCSLIHQFSLDACCWTNETWDASAGFMIFFLLFQCNASIMPFRSDRLNVHCTPMIVNNIFPSNDKIFCITKRLTSD